MRKHVMVRIGGGWDTLDHYIVKHDPCRTIVAGCTDFIDSTLTLGGYTIFVMTKFSMYETCFNSNSYFR